MSPKQTLNIVQSLYERHKVLTYPRTDSRYLTSDMKNTLKDRIQAIGGDFKETTAKLLRVKDYNTKKIINNANALLANIDNAAGNDADRKFIKASALTFRAYAYEKLVHYYCYRWQDSNNGNIKKYSIQVSNDGKTWGKAVAEGEFENNRKEKTILLTTPVKARFVRLTALSEQSGQDFATGAEFKVLEK